MGLKDSRQFTNPGVNAWAREKPEQSYSTYRMSCVQIPSRLFSELLSKKFTKYRTPQPLRAWSADPLLLSSQTGHPPNRVIASSSIKPGEPDKVRFSFGLLLLLVFYLTRTHPLTQVALTRTHRPATAGVTTRAVA